MYLAVKTCREEKRNTAGYEWIFLPLNFADGSLCN